MCIINPKCTCSSSIHWCFTFNNPQKNPEAIIDSLPKSMSYLIQAEEIAPSTGTPHLQGYCQFIKKTKKCSAILALTKKVKSFQDLYHLIKCNGSDMDNYNYCRKLDDHGVYQNASWVEYGTRSEIQRVHKSVKILLDGKYLEPIHQYWLDYELERIQFHQYLLIRERYGEIPTYDEGNYLMYYWEKFQKDPDPTFEKYLKLVYSKYPQSTTLMPQLRCPKGKVPFILV